jgi:hypothetical protein
VVGSLDESAIFPSVEHDDVHHTLLMLTPVVVSNVPPSEPVEQTLIATKCNMVLGES